MGLAELYLGRTGSKAIRLMQPVSYPRKVSSEPVSRPDQQSAEDQPGLVLPTNPARALHGARMLEVRYSRGNGVPPVSATRDALLGAGK